MTLGRFQTQSLKFKTREIDKDRKQNDDFEKKNATFSKCFRKHLT